MAASAPDWSEMMIQQLLVGLDGSEYSDMALRHSLALAKAWQATLHGVHVVDIVQVESPLIHDIAGAIGAAPLHNLTSLMRENLEYRGEFLLSQFRQSCEAAGVTYAEHLVTGVVAAEITQLSHEVDLVVLGRGGVHSGLSQALLGSTTEAVVRASAKPTMVTTQQFTDIRKPLLATDGSPCAMAALSMAIEFAQHLQLPLSVVYCASTPADRPDFLDGIQRQVMDRGIACQVDMCQGNAHEDLMQYVREQGHDFLLMGAFGHRRIVEWILGSTTQYALRTSPIPLLLCHDEPRHRHP